MRSRILILALALAGIGAPVSAEQGYLAITGPGNQQLRGEITEGNKQNQHEVIDFAFGTSAAPVGAGTLVRRSPPTVKFTLRWNRSTWALLRAQAKNEVLPNVRFSVWGKPPEDNGIPLALNDQLEFEKARVTLVQIIDRNGDAEKLEPVVEVTFTYQTMRIVHMQGGETWENTWGEQ